MKSIGSFFAYMLKIHYFCTQMRQRRYIAWLLLVVSMVMLTASVLPHHHHQDVLCVHSSVNGCSCDCVAEGAMHKTTSCSHEHQTCGAECVTHFQTFGNEDAQGFSMPDDSYCSLLYVVADILSIPLPLFDVGEKYTSLYLEKLHATCQPHVMGLRAPPCILA